MVTTCAPELPVRNWSACSTVRNFPSKTSSINAAVRGDENSARATPVCAGQCKRHGTFGSLASSTCIKVQGDEIGIRSFCYLALTFDHRLVDGAMADQFTGRIKQILENWSEEVF